MNLLRKEKTTNGFQAALQEERKTLVPIAEPRELPAALERKEKATEALRAYMAARGTVSMSATAQEHDLRETVRAANQAVADLESAKGRAAPRLKEIDRLLNAADEAVRFRAEHTKASGKVRDARRRLAQIQPIESALQGEVAELKHKRATLVGQAGRDELAARLAGKPAVPPKGLAALDEDLESRTAALNAAQEARTEIEASLPPLIEEARLARAVLTRALKHRAELAYYESLQDIMPIIARLVITGSDLRGFRANSDEFIVRCDDKTIREARDALERELDEA